MKHKLIFGLMVFMVMGMAACHESDHNHQDETTMPQASLLSDSLTRAATVYMTTDQKDNPVVSWTEEDQTGLKKFFFARWDVTAGQFGEKTEIPIAQNASIHEEGMPKIAINGDGTVVAIYEASVPQSGSKWGVGDVLFIRSADGGRNWSEPASVNTHKSPDASMSFSGICRLADGGIGVSWLDANPAGSDKPGRPVMFARTTADGGFDKPILIEKMACECCRIAVAATKDGRVSVAYRDLQPDNVRDISICSSFDSGKSFSAPEDVSGDDWQINGCPHNGPSVVAANDRLYVVWYTGGSNSGIYYAAMDQHGNRLQKNYLNRNARFVQIALMPDGTTVAAYNESYQQGDSVCSRIVLHKLGEEGSFIKNVQSPGQHANFPVVQAAGKDQLLLAWRDGDRIYWQLNKVSDICQKAGDASLSPDLMPLKGMEEMHGMVH